MVGLVVYAVTFAVSWVSAALSLVPCGLMALYYAFDQASVPAAVEPGDHQPTGRSAQPELSRPRAPVSVGMSGSWCWQARSTWTIS
jgi:hypothetical protein